MTEKPGVEPADKKPDGAETPAKKRRLGPLFATLGAVGFAALMVSRCDSGDQTQSQAPASPATPSQSADAAPVKVEQRGPYYQVVRHTLPRDEKDAKKSDVSYAPGSCVAEFRDANGRTGSHPDGLMKVHVYMHDDTAYPTYIRKDDLKPIPEGSFAAGQCWSTRELVVPPEIKPTYVIKNEDINLRDVPDMNGQKWGILNNGSCVFGTGQKTHDMMQIEAIPDANNTYKYPAYKWVPTGQLHVAVKEPCTASFYQIPKGHPGAGQTVNPWKPN